MIGVHLAGLTLVLAVLMLVPFSAGVLLAVRLGARHRTLLVSFGLSGVGVLGAATFGGYLISPTLGRGFAIGATVALAILAGWLGIRLSGEDWRAVRELAPPTGMWATYSLASVALGYLHGGLTGRELTAQFRFIHPLPYDNALPFWLAQQLESAHRPLPSTLPPHGAWQGSDRPPLQTGVYLAEQAFLRVDASMVHYQVLGVLAQSLWIFGLWALLRATGRGARVSALVLAAVMFSGFAILNTFFTWPKLLAAAFLLALAAITLTPDFAQLRGRRATGWAAGLLIGLALLSHTGSFFAVLGIGITLLICRRLPPWRALLATAIGAVALFGPWILYQKYYDPPGNHLTWLQLAPLVPSSQRYHTGLLTMIIDSYQRAGLSGTVHAKIENLKTPFHGIAALGRDVWSLVRAVFESGSHAAQVRDNAAASIREANYYYLLPTLGLYTLGPVGLLIAWWRRRRTRLADTLRVEWLLLLCLAVNYLVWALVLFGPGQTLIHQSSYFLPILAFTVGVLGWWALSPAATYVVVAVQSAWTVWLYTAFTPLRSGPGTPLTPRIQPSMALVGALALVACVGIMAWTGQRRFEPTSCPPDVPHEPADTRESYDLRGGAASAVG